MTVERALARRLGVGLAGEGAMQERVSIAPGAIALARTLSTA